MRNAAELGKAEMNAQSPLRFVSISVPGCAKTTLVLRVVEVAALDVEGVHIRADLRMLRFESCTRKSGLRVSLCTSYASYEKKTKPKQKRRREGKWTNHSEHVQPAEAPCKRDTDCIDEPAKCEKSWKGGQQIKNRR
jgi:hypothetical protein